MRLLVFKHLSHFDRFSLINYNFLLTISPLPPRTMLSRPFEQTRWHAIVITTLFWGGGEGAANIKSQEFLHLIVAINLWD